MLDRARLPWGALGEGPSEVEATALGERARLRVGAAALLAGWAVVTVAVALKRPGELLEIASIGLAGAAAFELLQRSAGLSLRRAGLALVCFAAPLLNTLPARKYAAVVDARPAAVRPLLALFSILVVVALLAAARVDRRPQRWPPLLLAATFLLVAGALLGSAGARDHGGALSATWFEFAAPLLLLFAVRRQTDGAA